MRPHLRATPRAQTRVDDWGFDERDTWNSAWYFAVECPQARNGDRCVDVSILGWMESLYSIKRSPHDILERIEQNQMIFSGLYVPCIPNECHWHQSFDFCFGNSNSTGLSIEIQSIRVGVVFLEKVSIEDIEIISLVFVDIRFFLLHNS